MSSIIVIIILTFFLGSTFEIFYSIISYLNTGQGITIEASRLQKISVCSLIGFILIMSFTIIFTFEEIFRYKKILILMEKLRLEKENLKAESKKTT